MILDHLANISQYYPLNPNLEKAVIFAVHPATMLLEAGRYDIAGDDAYAIIAVKSDEAKTLPLESHRKYLDVHIVLRGNDEISWKPAHACTADKNGYNLQGDYCLYTDSPVKTVEVSENEFVIFFPGDAHAPMQGDAPCKKVILKIRHEA